MNTSSFLLISCNSMWFTQYVSTSITSHVFCSQGVGRQAGGWVAGWMGKSGGYWDAPPWLCCRSLWLWFLLLKLQIIKVGKFFFFFLWVSGWGLEDDAQVVFQLSRSMWPCKILHFDPRPWEIGWKRCLGPNSSLPSRKVKGGVFHMTSMFYFDSGTRTHGWRWEMTS